MPDPTALEVLTSIRRIVRAVSLHSRKLGRDAGLTVPQLLTLRAVDAAGPDGTTASDILETVGVSPATLSGIVQRMVLADLLQRTRSTKDRRRVLLTLTARGRDVLRGAPRPLQARFVERFEGLDVQDKQALVDALQQVVDMMEAGQIDASPILTDHTDVGPSRN